MARFRTKPFEIEAEQYIGTGNDLERWLGMISKNQDVGFSPRIRGANWAENVEGETKFPIEVYDELHDTWVKVAYGNWIIKGQKGEYYPCDDEIFRAKYEQIV